MVTVQTEHLDNHTARLTVDVPQERIEKAVRQAARQISKKARIPGFRPGKAPFNYIVSMFGHEYVLSQALDNIGNDIYKEALEASEIEPYAPGSLDDVEEAGHKLIFVVPKRLTIDLGDYRSIRVEYEEPEVTDEMVNDAMQNLLEQQAVIEDVDRPAQMGDQVQIEHFYVGVLLNEEEIAEMEADAEASDDAAADSEASVDEDNAEADDAEDADTGEASEVGDDADDDAPERQLFHQHDWSRVLRADDKDLFPGFSAELVGVQAGDELEFYLDVPEDYDDDEVAGRRLRIEAHVSQVQARTVPEWTDELAKKVSEDDAETLLDLRVQVREQLDQQAKTAADNDAAQAALDKLVEGATINYPAELVDDYLDDMVQDLERNMLSPQGLTLDHYLTMTGQTQEEFREGYRESAAARAERSLALGELVNVEQLETTDSDIEGEIDKMVEQMGDGENASQFRAFFDSPMYRSNISNQLASDRAIGRLVAIAKGEDPAIGVQRDEVEADDAEEADSGAGDEAEAADSATETDAADVESDASASDASSDDAGEPEESTADGDSDEGEVE